LKLFIGIRKGAVMGVSILRNMKKMSAVLLSAAMVISGLSFQTEKGTAQAAEQSDFENISPKIDKTAYWTETETASKSDASDLVGKVSLLMPGKEKSRELDVVFAIDKSSSGEYANFSGEADTLLKGLAAIPNLTVKVGVVVGDCYPRNALYVTSNGKYKDFADITNDPDAKAAVKTAMTTSISDSYPDGLGYLRSSNMSGIVEKANELLEPYKNSNTQKDIVLFNDMISYTYMGDISYTDEMGTAHALKDVPLGKYFDSCMTPSEYYSAELTTKGYTSYRRTNMQFADWSALKEAYSNGVLDSMGWNKDAVCYGAYSSVGKLPGNAGINISNTEYNNLIAFPKGQWSPSSSTVITAACPDDKNSTGQHSVTNVI
jgi:hypothetical protein